MLFSSIVFLYFFLPPVIAVYFLIPRRYLWARNALLLLASVVFYAWGEPKLLLLIAAQILSGWGFGLLINRFRGNKRLSRLFLIAALVVGIGALGFFKYTDFFLGNINSLFRSDIGLLKIALPLGISFYTFQILSYDIDLYWGKVGVQKNPADFATYVMLFPQLIAGPIVRYSDIETDLRGRVHSLELFAAGVRRFIMGLGKKVLLANALGELVALYKEGHQGSVLFTWLYIAAFALQIYFDFSGYSDMAIGMGKMFGFRFLENFNYPYIARSITDFWRRWHISLSTWFRDYVYIPLGGSRVKHKWRHILNILIVWLLTGFWHGAAWNFMLWGVYFGLILLFEKFVLKGKIDKLPRALSSLYVLLLVIIGWVLFDAASLREVGTTLGHAVGIGADNFADRDALYSLRSYAVIFVIAAIGATPLPKFVFGRLEKGLSGKRRMEWVFAALEPIFVAAVLLAVTGYLVDGSFNPFIYFRF